MAVQIDTEEIRQEVLIVKIKGKLTAADYDVFVPRIEEMLENGKIRILFQMEDFDGWTASAAWEDTKFGLKHFNDIERIALVGHKTLEKGMALLCKAFTTADVKFFETGGMKEAKEWIGLKNGGL